MIRFGAARRFAEDCIARFDVKCGGADSEAKSLSGGNLQKFIVGREIMQEPKLLVAGPAHLGRGRGRRRRSSARSLLDLRNSGTAILVISEELDELFEICDRLVVIAKGTPVADEGHLARPGWRRSASG